VGKNKGYNGETHRGEVKKGMSGRGKKIDRSGIESVFIRGVVPALGETPLY
jgi:hypothetical protein